jgi:hypothetical protein
MPHLEGRVTGRLLEAETELLAELAGAPRGPRQDGTFAVWLLFRYCDGLLPPAPLSDRIARRRLEQLERRLSSLSMPAALRRGVSGAFRELRDSQADAIALALRQLVAPSREALGTAVGTVVAQAARLARDPDPHARTTP